MAEVREDNLSEIASTKKFLSRRETASYLDSTERYTYMLEDDKKLTKFKVGGKVYYPREQVEALFRQPDAKALKQKGK